MNAIPFFSLKDIGTALAMSATDATPDLEAAVTLEVNATEVARQEIKDKEHERVQTKAIKAEAEAETDRLATEAAASEEARLATEVAAAEKTRLAAEAAAEKTRLAAEAEAAKAEAADEVTRLAKGKASNIASIIAASMLAQICERAFMEHQLSARHFAFYHFCEHAPILCVCVCLCPLAALTALTALH